MPDDEYMNDTQLAFFRMKLVELKSGILANADQTAENLRDDTVVVPDPADRATIEEEHALELRTRDRERKLLKKIEQSIARIDAGDYGYCDETGEPIGVPRLLARPTATLSLEAQQRREMKQKMFGDSTLRTTDATGEFQAMSNPWIRAAVTAPTKPWRLAFENGEVR